MFDLAFELQEQIRALEAGGPLPREVGTNVEFRVPYVALTKRRLRLLGLAMSRRCRFFRLAGSKQTLRHRKDDSLDGS